MIKKRFLFPILSISVFLSWTSLQFWGYIYPEILWFTQLGFDSVFWITLKSKACISLFSALLFFIIVITNIFIASHLGKDRRKQKKTTPDYVKRFLQRLFSGHITPNLDEDIVIDVNTGTPLSEKVVTLFWIVGTLIFSIFVGLSALTQWETVLKALNASSFGIADPIFNLDIGFYIFQYPFYRFIQGYLFSTFIVSLITSLFIYFSDANISFSNPLKINFGRGVKLHLCILLIILVLLFSIGLWLGELSILYSSRGVVYGAGYTDVNAQLLGYNLQIIVLCVLALFLLINAFQNNLRLPIYGLIAYLVVAVLMGGIYPGLVQNIRVKPNEITFESPYIKNAIKYTRLAYGLNNIVEKEFVPGNSLSYSDIRKNSETINNIRIWDPRPLIKTYRQLQGIRLYYDFIDVDIDRYSINGSYQQVMLSPRELKVEKLPPKAQTWINQHLVYTHGYGLCMSPVANKTNEGLPDLIIKDIPPSTETNLKIEQPAIYFGEETNNYVIVNSLEKEFDYPKGDKNVGAEYKGTGGIKVGSFIRRLLFTIKFSDMKFLLSQSINAESRVLFNRSIRNRINTIAPFLKYDQDPYVVIADDGKLYWIQDAYTVSDLYPYSDPIGRGFSQINYIRNSVKVVVDAYNGSVNFYIIDQNDPIANTYSKIFPKLFKPFASMPNDLKKHIRYPYDLFMIQANKYTSFHMQDPQVFYNQEDLWNFPKEIYDGREQAMEGYYIIMKLPQEKKEEFMLIFPFTPNDKDNMIAWMAARCDVPNYGKLVIYKFSKDKLIYGPRQIEARIDQQTEISQQFTLWGQIGSRVIRGNLLAIPIEDTILYVEPVFLEASQGELPELKRIIVAFGSNVAMAESLDQALSMVLSGKKTSVLDRSQLNQPILSIKQKAQKAFTIYNESLDYLRQGNFSEFGDRYNELKNLLRDLSQ